MAATIGAIFMKFGRAPTTLRIFTIVLCPRHRRQHGEADPDLRSTWARHQATCGVLRLSSHAAIGMNLGSGGRPSVDLLPRMRYADRYECPPWKEGTSWRQARDHEPLYESARSPSSRRNAGRLSRSTGGRS